MKKYLSFLFCSINLFYFSQRQITVLDSETKLAIPFAKILLDSGKSYINTEENGTAILNSDQTIFSVEAFGYISEKGNYTEKTIYLKPKSTEIAEVKIPRSLNTKQWTEGKIKKEFVVSFFIASNIGQRVVDLFSYEKNYPENAFIKNIRFLTDVKKTNQDAVIKVIFLENENGKPSTEIWKSYNVICKAGKNITEYIFDKPFLFPKGGLFIGFEWILNSQNSYPQKMSYTNVKGEKVKAEINRINPDIISQTSDNNNIWSGFSGKWIQLKNLKTEKENSKLSIELGLSN